MIEKEKTLCFTGHRTEKLPKTAEAQEALKLAIFKEIDTAIAQGFDTFLMGACYGFDLMAAAQVNYRRHIIKPDDPGKIILIAVVPFEGQANRWSEQDRELYFSILPLCDEVVTLNAHGLCQCPNKPRTAVVASNAPVYTEPAEKVSILKIVKTISH